jgi:hypothetical protein
MDWFDLAQDRDWWWALLKHGNELQVPQNAGNFFSSREPVSISRRTVPWIEWVMKP